MTSLRRPGVTKEAGEGSSYRLKKCTSRCSAVWAALQALTGLPVLLSGLVLSIVGVVWLLAISTQQAEREARYIEQSSQLLMLSQRLAKDAREAVLGQPIAFKTLKESRDRFDLIVNTLRDGDLPQDILASPPEVAEQLTGVIKLWAPKANEGVRAQVDQILGQEKSLFNMHDRVMAINQMSPLLLAVADEVMELGAQAGMEAGRSLPRRSPGHVVATHRQGRQPVLPGVATRPRSRRPSSARTRNCSRTPKPS